MAVSKTIPIAKIHVPERLRAVEEDHALAISASIVEHGLLNPVTVRATPAAKGGAYTLVAGAHRLRAMELLDEMEIDAVVVDADQQESVLLEITENLFRNELSVIDRAVFVQTYRDVWESKYGKVEPGRPENRVNITQLMEDEARGGFSKHVARRMGVSPETVKLLTRISQRLHSDLRAAVRGTPVADNQAALLKLAKMEPQEQRRAAIALRAEGGDLKKALGHVKAVRSTEKPEAKRDGMLKALLEIWSKADDATRKAFLAEIGVEDAA
ncbi:ParB N-terminal domain-containing protein [Martelella mediterranea]|uniref:ParB N-terminal domain-containing protein n=1 Tax=Martelella mediterranea TaxID=293089 RepID=UPI001E5EDC45|nr:ParB N-terminal domain-containing protein [Martelella mediterranea]MCD1634459.1 ParB N-terminal domain-containing protein [Martelella mediterranea]